MNQITIVTGADADTLIPDRLAVKYWRAYEMAQNQPEGYTTDNDFFVTAQKVNNTKWGRQYAADVRSNAIFTRRSYEKEGEGIKFGPWLRLAFAESPQVFELPLINGFEKWQGNYKNVYYKTQSDIVTVHIAVQKAEGQITGANEIAKLPVGFLPDGLYHSAAYAFNPFQLAHIHINANGNITARPDTTSNCILGTISFLAAH